MMSEGVTHISLEREQSIVEHLQAETVHQFRMQTEHDTEVSVCSDLTVFGPPVAHQ